MKGVWGMNEEKSCTGGKKERKEEWRKGASELRKQGKDGGKKRKR